MNVILLENESVLYSPVICLFLMFALKNILVLLAKLDSGEQRCPATALIMHGNFFSHFQGFPEPLETLYNNIVYLRTSVNLFALS